MAYHCVPGPSPGPIHGPVHGPTWSYSIVVSTEDFESFNLGSNPSRIIFFATTGLNASIASIAKDLSVFLVCMHDT